MTEINKSTRLWQSLIFLIIGLSIGFGFYKSAITKIETLEFKLSTTQCKYVNLAKLPYKVETLESEVDALHSLMGDYCE